LALLTDSEIITHVRNKRLIVDPFDRRNVMPSSYDLSASDSALIEGKHFKFEKLLAIRPRQFALLATRERVGLPLDFIGRLYLRSYLSRQGLLPESQGRVEAGYRGTLTLPVMNSSTIDIEIPLNNPIATIEFEKLPRKVAHGYSGRYQDSHGPTNV
jgi:deoxycytidine triphosphate deaminase